MPVEFPNPVEFISAVNINPHDLIDYGRYVLPLVRGELAHRHATGQRGTLQAEHLGNYEPRYSEYATAAGALA